MSAVSGSCKTEKEEAQEEVEHRLAQVLPTDRVRGVFFRSVQQAILVSKGEAAMEECLEECEERDFMDFFAYPAADFLRMVRRAAWLLRSEEGGFEETMRMLGYMGTAAFLESQAGKAMEVLIAGTPRRALENLPMAYLVTTPTGGPLTVSWPEHMHCRLTFSRDFLPRPYVEGTLEAHLKKAGARAVRVTGRWTGGLASEYELSWEQ
jgi:uncharacterized protein (TIGR02265 family)